MRAAPVEHFFFPFSGRKDATSNQMLSMSLTDISPLHGTLTPNDSSSCTFVLQLTCSSSSARAYGDPCVQMFFFFCGKKGAAPENMHMPTPATAPVA